MGPEKTQNTGCVVSAATRSSGKSVVSIGLAAAARNRQWSIQCFKKGPDYIDPLWLSAASASPCINLDPVLQSPTELQHTFETWRRRDGFSLVEGSMGLHDGLLEDFSDSNASLSRNLNLPTLLVVDGQGMNRTIASVVNGLVNFDPLVQYKGVILNRVRTARHEEKLCNAIAEYTDLDVLGVVPHSSALQIDEKELGLIPAIEHDFVSAKIKAVTEIVVGGCDIDRILAPEPGQRVDPLTTYSGQRAKTSVPVDSRFRVAIARDAAFQFYYHDDIEALTSRGVELVEVSPLADAFPDDVDGLILGGGFPERHARQLSKNVSFMQSLRDAVARGMAVRAECGGLMYLAHSLRVDDQIVPMTGVIPGKVRMHDRPVGRGYMQLEPLVSSGSAGAVAQPGVSNGPGFVDEMSECNAHEFHHSSIALDADADYEFVFRVNRGYGIDGEHDGIRVGNVIASYAHLRDSARTPWIDAFIAQLRDAQTAMANSDHGRVTEYV